MSAAIVIRALLPAAAAGMALVPQIGAAQTILSDYESADQAQKARQNALWRLAFRPSLQVLGQTVATLRQSARLSPADATALDALVATAKGLPEPEARRTLWHAVALVQGHPWDATAEMVGAITIKLATPVITSDVNSIEPTMLYPVRPAAGAHYSVTLNKGISTTSATPQRGSLLRELAAGSISGELPGAIKVDFSGVPDGFYLLITRITAPDGTSDDIATPFYLVRDLARRRAELDAALAPIAGHDAAKQIAAYPFALAQAVNEGKREVIAYDFNAAITRSSEIAAKLKAGKDPVYQAKGLQNRAYRFAETGELVPYQLYVPSTWRPDRTWPLVVALHGANLDETNMLGRANGRMQQLAEQHGFIVVAPLGYRINSGYGSARGMSAIGAGGERLRRSEADVLAVTDLVTAEYNADPKRSYLTGNSMGGGGTWWIGGHHPNRWAALAPAAFGGVIAEDVPGLSRVPILAIVGDRDELGMLDRVKAAVKALRDGGVEPRYLEIAGGTHSSAYDIAMPEIFDFFEKHAK